LLFRVKRLTVLMSRIALPGGRAPWRRLVETAPFLRQRWENFRHAPDELVTVLEGQMDSRWTAPFTSRRSARSC
jgi:hypothetical protein